MLSEISNDEVIQLAFEVRKTLEEILSGITDPSNPDIQRWATARFIWLSDHTNTDEPLPKAIQDCLVDIMSCDGASWDTSPEGFRANLARLEKALRRTRQR
jgi:hypothetical protein